MTTLTDGSYRERILGYVGDRDPLASLEASASALRAQVERLGPAGLGKAYAPGKWTGAQVLAHLADVEMGLGFRIRQALAEDQHRIQGFDEAAWARRYTVVDPQLALGAFSAARAWNLALFRSLSDADLDREAVHPDRGPESVRTIVRMLAGHDVNHLKQLESL